MAINQNLPSYEKLFGAIDFEKGDEARSVYAPAAYLTDLLQMRDDYFLEAAAQEGNGASLDHRRPSIKDIELNAKNTFRQTRMALR